MANSFTLRDRFVIPGRGDYFVAKFDLDKNGRPTLPKISDTINVSGIEREVLSIVSEHRTPNYGWGYYGILVKFLEVKRKIFAVAANTSKDVPLEKFTAALAYVAARVKTEIDFDLHAWTLNNKFYAYAKFYDFTIGYFGPHAYCGGESGGTLLARNLKQPIEVKAEHFFIVSDGKFDDVPPPTYGIQTTLILTNNVEIDWPLGPIIRI